MKTIFEGQSLKGLRAKGCQDGLFANSPSPWMSLLYGSYYMVIKTPARLIGWTGLGAGDGVKAKHPWV